MAEGSNTEVQVDVVQQLNDINIKTAPREYIPLEPDNKTGVDFQEPEKTVSELLVDQYKAMHEGLINGSLAPTPGQLEQYAETLLKLSKEGSQKDQDRYALEISSAPAILRVLKGDFKDMPNEDERLLEVVKARRPFSIEKKTNELGAQAKRNGGIGLQSADELTARAQNADNVLNVINTVALANVSEDHLRKLDPKPINQ